MDKKIGIYYDGVCKLCAGLVDEIEKSSQKDAFFFIPVTGADLPAGVTEREAMRDVYVLDTDGKLYKGAEAVLRVFDEYPSMQWLARIGRLPGFKQLGAGVYRLIAMNRYWMFGRKNV